MVMMDLFLLKDECFPPKHRIPTDVCIHHGKGYGLARRGKRDKCNESTNSGDR
jgi:hypothetical protein